MNTFKTKTGRVTLHLRGEFINRCGSHHINNTSLSQTTVERLVSRLILHQITKLTSFKCKVTHSSTSTGIVTPGLASGSFFKYIIGVRVKSVIDLLEMINEKK